MFCNKCENSFYMQAFSRGKCLICGVEVVTPHIPPYKLCEQHSNELNRCQQCGKEMLNENLEIIRDDGSEC